MEDHSSIFPNVLWNHIREAERSAPADRPVVLVVEDDPSSRILMRYALRDVVRTDAASTVADALQMAETVPYDGLLVDLRLPDGQGTEVVDALREESPYWGVPMVAVTAHSLPDGSGPFLDAGFDAYVAKPFEQDDLRTLVRHLVVEENDAVDKGRKLVRSENGPSARDEKSARNESRREAPPTKQINTDTMPDLN